MTPKLVEQYAQVCRKHGVRALKVIDYDDDGEPLGELTLELGLAPAEAGEPRGRRSDGKPVDHTWDATPYPDVIPE